jgi:hypothetical protein
LSVPEFVKDGSTGFLTGSASMEDIYRGIIRALTFSDKLDVGSRARDTVVRHFSYPVVRRGLLEAYNSMLPR